MPLSFLIEDWCPSDGKPLLLHPAGERQLATPAVTCSHSVFEMKKNVLCKLLPHSLLFKMSFSYIAGIIHCVTQVTIYSVWEMYQLHLNDQPCMNNRPETVLTQRKYHVLCETKL